MYSTKQKILEAKRFLKNTEQLQNEGLFDWAKQKINKGRAYLSGGDEEAINLLNQAKDELVHALNIIFEHPELKDFENKAFPLSGYLRKKFNNKPVDIYNNELDFSLYEFQIPYLVRSIVKYSGKLYQIEQSDPAFNELRKEIINNIHSDIDRKHRIEDEEEIENEGEDDAYFSPDMLGSVERKYKQRSDKQMRREIEDEINQWNEEKLNKALKTKYNKFMAALEKDKENAFAVASNLSVTVEILEKLFNKKIMDLNDTLAFSKKLEKNHFLFESAYSDNEFMSQKEFSKLMLKKIDSNKWYDLFVQPYRKIVHSCGQIQEIGFGVLGVFQDKLIDNHLRTHEDVVDYYKHISSCYSALKHISDIMNEIINDIYDIIRKSKTRSLLKATKKISLSKLDTSDLGSQRSGRAYMM